MSAPDRNQTADRDRVMPSASEQPASEAGVEERPLPFVLRRCLTVLDVDELPGDDNVELRYWRRAGLTGEVTLTAGGRDVDFSDLEAS